VFLFAPLFHPAMKNVASIRKELGVPTLFNFLGPLLNPARPQVQVIGTTSISLAREIATALSLLGISRALILSSKDGLDEANPRSSVVCFFVKKGKVRKKIIDPSTLGFKKRGDGNLRGGSPAENAHIIKSILSGDRGSKRDTVILNSALAISVYKQVSIKEGIVRATQAIDSGKAIKKLEEYIYLSNNI